MPKQHCTAASSSLATHKCFAAMDHDAAVLACRLLLLLLAEQGAAHLRCLGFRLDPKPSCVNMARLSCT